MTATVSLEGFRSSPKPYIKLFTEFKLAHEVEEVRKQRAKKNNKQFYRVAYAGGKQPPEDLNDADALTDWLDERGIIENEWQRIKLIMDSARKLEVDVKKGGDLDTS